MTYKLVELQQLAAKIESTEGTAISMSASDVQQVRNIKFTYGIPRYEKKTRRASFSKFNSVGGSRMGTIEFDMDLDGLGASHALSGSEIFLQACGLANTSGGTNAQLYTASSIWDYSSLSTSKHKSLTIGGYIDGGLRKICGARGNCVLSAKSGQPIIAKFTFTGALVDYSEATMLTSITYPVQQKTPPLFYNAAMSVGGSGGFATGELLVDTFELDFGNVVQMRADANSATGYRSAAIVDRDARFKFDPEMVSISDHDFYAIWKAETTAALSLSITGSNDTAENKITITAPALQYEDVQDGERGQLWIKDIGAALRGSAAAGDDEFVIKLGT